MTDAQTAARWPTGPRLILLSTAVLAALVSGPLAAQSPPPSASEPNAAVRRVADRIQALQAEATRLAGESRTLIGQIRALEIERDLRANEAQSAEATVTASAERLAEISGRIEVLEVQRVAGLPSLEAQLVRVYKRGRSSYLRLLLMSATGLRDFGRVNRAVSALTFREERIISDHRQTLDAVRTERDALGIETSTLQERSASARQARMLADRAVSNRAALIARIDSARDLTAQYVGELQQAHTRLQEQLTSPGAGAARIPIAPFQGALAWPAPGRITGAFGQPSTPLAGGLVHNGVEIAAALGTPAQAVHDGTVSYAGGFTGLGSVVIVDHGDQNHTVYGYLDTPTVRPGDHVAAGDIVGRVGSSPTGAAALYFELHVDGRFVDPLQWLKPR